MNLLVLEPPYSRLFHDLAKELKPLKTFVHLFNVGYLVYLPRIPFCLIRSKIRHKEPSPTSLSEISKIRSLMNSNIKSPTAEELKVMGAYLEYLDEFVNQNRITHIICHNDLRWQHAIAKHVAEKYQLTIFFSEEGLFRPDTMTFDPKGVNALSSIPRESSFYTENSFAKQVDFVPIRAGRVQKLCRLLRFVAFLALTKVGEILSLNVPLKNKDYSFSKYLRLFFANLKPGRFTPESLHLEQGYIFVPLQVSTDTQTILHSKFKGTQEFIDLVENTYEQLPPMVKRKYALVFKKHPMETPVRYRFNPGSIVSTATTSSLLSGCSLVVLINSSTITEALEKKKPIVALGESQYEIEGVVLRAAPHELGKSIEKMLLTQRDKKEITESFLNFLKFHYQINGNIFYYNTTTLKRLGKRLREKTAFN